MRLMMLLGTELCIVVFTCVYRYTLSWHGATKSSKPDRRKGKTLSWNGYVLHFMALSPFQASSGGCTAA